jgi:nucleoside-diphosphate-sugar epimerase
VGELIVVTGAAGFVGAALTARLVGLGHRVIAVTRADGSTARLDGLRGQVDVRPIDLTSQPAIARLLDDVRPSLCYHVAAAGATSTTADSDALVAVNTLAPLALARSLAGTTCRRLVTVGSSSEYGPSTLPMVESMVARPDDLYGATKLAGGLLAGVAARSAGLSATHARLFSVYGPGEDRQRLIAAVAAAVVAGVPIDLTEGAQRRDLIFVDDVVDALVLAIDAPTPPAVFNVGTGTASTVREACLALADAAGADRGLLRFGARDYRPAERFRWCADTDLARATIGFVASTSLQSGAARTVAALRANA